jgi:hypothetical protein
MADTGGALVQKTMLRRCSLPKGFLTINPSSSVPACYYRPQPWV